MINVDIPYFSITLHECYDCEKYYVVKFPLMRQLRLAPKHAMHDTSYKETLESSSGDTCLTVLSVVKAWDKQRSTITIFMMGGVIIPMITYTGHMHGECQLFSY